MTVPVGPTVMLLAADPAVAHAVQFCFETEGLAVRCVTNIDDLGLERPPREGCLILDHHLPEVDGLALLERLRAEGVWTPVVLITTHPRADFRARAAMARAPVVEKPLLTDELLTAVRTALGQTG